MRKQRTRTLINEIGEIGLRNRIQALKIVTQAFLSEVEALEYSRPRATDARVQGSLSEEVRRLEIDLIRYALMRTSGHQAEAARLLGLKPTTLNSKIKRYQIAGDLSPAIESARAGSEEFNTEPDGYVV
jgi:transcriptional regulator with GAF, ATPase, and Fis domain